MAAGEALHIHAHHKMFEATEVEVLAHLFEGSVLKQLKPLIDITYVDKLNSERLHALVTKSTRAVCQLTQLQSVYMSHL